MIEIIPKFINLLQRDRKLIIHGDGQHSRRYLYAGDAADAFDTILHKGTIGHIYNVDSTDEMTNLELAAKLQSIFGRPGNQIEYTEDRPFNDRRYAVDGSKLRELGWKQKTTFEEGLKSTVDWYAAFGEWWGDITGVLSAFPVVKHDGVHAAANESSVNGKNGHFKKGEDGKESRTGAANNRGKHAEDGFVVEDGLKIEEDGTKTRDGLHDEALHHQVAKKRKVELME